MSNLPLPIVAITIGDPAGIGPEITLDTIIEERVYQECKPFLIGSIDIVKRAMKIKKCNFEINKINHPSEGKFQYGIIDVLETGSYDCESIEYGKVQKLAGQMSYDYVLKSIELGLNKEIDVVATAPIHKEAIKLANCPQPGHTEIYGELTHSDYALTMFNCRNLKVFFVSRHKALKEACDYATKERVLDSVHQINKELVGIGLKNPKIAVAALNPHASDNGLFGTEEADHLIPAVQTAQEQGINAVGPVPADSVFHLGLQGRYDAILSLYHDQGHIACKTLDFERSITITWGLPFMRSSVDHGTAFDIAGKGIAGSVSMLEATLVAVDYWKMKQKNLAYK
ncbi:4-hydroxythreonine-4-phosphate dehydrogenase PdxA [Priestia endophytica]|jgi:4-phospho-D-threonate 3-dehydrogenase / 4-phospho-D-erythronate 3-dehydrogenase|uniref:4-hydroxythreonine-4-phosphate dehydrogenase PdxA n=1 Tax=Priestia endophytica TaxID=135735 RepID=UPI000F5448BD|nr:4-hydroxythreonine-4-phosphate dehydrogenase PdxA [Priestia endophytica]MED4069918.1 4-hydroxythreonine-4-phosphate dehydrogenase PdxA [Priestia endophytica]RPK15087.1 4-hydroxythreonine-4-phosphate dehydrogenase [Priestia endophytica]